MDSKDMSASGQTSGTDTQPRFIDDTSENVTSGTSQPSLFQTFQTTTFSAEDFLVRLSAFLEEEGGSMTPEVHYFLTSHGFFGTKDPDIFYSKTSRVYLVTKLEKLSKQCLGFSPILGMEFNGNYLIRKTLGSPKAVKGYTLSDILEKNPDPKYFLSTKALKYVLRSLDKAGIKTPESIQLRDQLRQLMHSEAESEVKQDSTK